jgi:hypothetical protein
MNKLIQWFNSVEWKHGFEQLFIAIDQLLNVIFGNPFSKDTWSDETISSRCGRKGNAKPYMYYRIVIDWLFQYILWQGPDHCVKAYQKEKTQYNMPPAMRKDQ